MKITTMARTVPDGSVHALQDLFGNEDSFELSTIRPEDASIAIEMLIGNYSAPMDAVIRELTVNAIDSHRAVGQQNPVQITMPTEDKPYLIVRDQGLGLSPTDMIGVFTRPAASTKRDENTSTGGLGIGAKAPFTVVDRFLVRGVKDGVSATLAMARIEGQLKHLVDHITPVDAGVPNGVEVIVPVGPSTIETWWKALSRVHFWWDQGLVEITNEDASPVKLPTWQERLLGGETPGPLPQVIVTPKLKQATVLMGQIGYRIPDGVAATGLPVLYRVPVGALTISPTREAIVDTAENREVLREMLHSWQNETFQPIVAQLLDPDTSIWSLWQIQIALNRDGLVSHIDRWIPRACSAEDRALLPQYGLRQLAEHLVPGKTWMRRGTIDVRPHGIPDETSARPRSIADLFERAGYAGFPKIVFCDLASLPEGKRKVLTKWARNEDLVVVVVDRTRLEEMRFPRHWGWSENISRTRPFAGPDEIEWLDPEDVQVARAPRERAPKIGENSLVTVVAMHGRHARHEMSVRELVDQVTSASHSYVIIDTAAELKELPYHLPEGIFVLQSGQRPARLTRELLGKRALTAEQFRAKQVEIVLKALTPAQRRWIADAELARNQGVREYFEGRNAWIDKIEDPVVRDIAQRISEIVTRANAYLDPQSEQSKNNVRFRAGIEYRAALETLLRDPNWLIANGALGEYLPALLAAESRGLGRTWSFSQPMVIDHIVATISTQLVTR